MSKNFKFDKIKNNLLKKCKNFKFFLIKPLIKKMMKKFLQKEKID